MESSAIGLQEFFNVAFRRFPAPCERGRGRQYLITVNRPLLLPFPRAVPTCIAGKYRLSWYDSLAPPACKRSVLCQRTQDGQRSNTCVSTIRFSSYT
jgi:hypothetical protein